MEPSSYDNAADRSAASSAIEEQLVEGRRAMTAAIAGMLDLVWELEESDEHPSACRDTATWLTWNLGLPGRTSRLWVRTAHALQDLPLLQSALASSTISFDQLQVILKAATPDNQEELIALARTIGSVDELRDAVCDREEPPPPPEPVPAPTVLDTWWQNDRLHVRGHVTGADGALVEKALLRLAAKAPKDPETGLFRDPNIRTGEALVQMASESMAREGNHDAASLVIHVSATDLLAGNSMGWDAAGRFFPIAELERLLCDARIQPALHDGCGVTVGVGRITRTIPRWLRRAMEARDQGCRFPGCTTTRWLHGHHIIPWSQLGPTNLDNLVSLCGFHHRLIHQEGWTIKGNPNHTLTFINKFGDVHRPALGRFPVGWIDSLLDGIDRKAEHRLRHLVGAAPP